MNSNILVNAQNVKLNFLKGIACIGVIFIHVKFPGKYGQIISSLSGVAVPIFFIVAGYYSYAKDKMIIKKKIIKITKIFLKAYTLYFLYNLLLAMNDYGVALWFQNNFNWKTPIKYIVFCTIDFAIPLWYLIAMIETYMVWFLVVHNKKEIYILKYIPILFILQILLTFYCDIMEMDWFWKINFFTRALPWYLFGYYLSSNKLRISKNMIKALIFIGGGIILISIILNLKLNFSIVGYIPLAFSLFSLTLIDQKKSINNLIEFIGEKLSLNIYILHPLIDLIIIEFCKNILKINIEKNIYLWCHPIIVFLVTIMISYVIYRFNTEIKNRLIYN